MIPAQLAAAIAALLTSWWIFTSWNARKYRIPGPKRLPIVGNALHLPKERQWITWEQWRKQYGDLVSFSVFGSENLVVSSLEVAIELLETRGLIYSDRPRSIMAGELVGWSRGLGYTPGPPNSRFKELRKLFNSFIGATSCGRADLQLVQEEENLKLLGKLLESSSRFMEHSRDATAAVLLRLSYGYHPSVEDNDALGLIKIVEDAMNGFSLASEPGWWVDSFPLLRYIPALPFHHAARRMREDLERLYRVPFEFVKRQRNNGTAKISFISSFLDEKNGNETNEDEGIINAAAASLYSGGAETTVSSLDSFFLAMALHPHVQERGQAAVDTYLESGAQDGPRLPRISDRLNLPYVEAMMLEILRWNPSVPLGLPHVCKQDDEYRGYHIKKGTVVWANIWSILQDETVFPNPREFKPERYLTACGKISRNSTQTITARCAFGFGRRICPGLYLAEDPNEAPQVQYDGFISHPRPFKCVIKPRSSEKEKTIRAALLPYA